MFKKIVISLFVFALIMTTQLSHHDITSTVAEARKQEKIPALKKLNLVKHWNIGKILECIMNSHMPQMQSGCRETAEGTQHKGKSLIYPGVESQKQSESFTK